MRKLRLISIFILILILRQSPSARILDHNSLSSSVIQKSNLIIGAQGLGWIEDINRGDPKQIMHVFQVVRNEEELFNGSTAPTLLHFPVHCHSNLLLIDLPPPPLRA